MPDKPRLAPPPTPSVPASAPLPASLPLFHEARYDVRYGIFGSVGELRFSVGGILTAPDGSPLVNIRASGEGAVLGLGAIQRRIEADFDPRALGSRRWTVVRLQNGQRDSDGIVDTARRDDKGALLLERVKPGLPAVRQTLTFAVPTSDPIGLLWRLRTVPIQPGRTETFQLLDGQTLWRVRITAAAGREILPDGLSTAIRFEGELAPIFYDGRPDSDRPSRRFTLWLSDRGNHLPLRLEVPVGPADVVMTLAHTRTLPEGPSASRTDRRPNDDSALPPKAQVDQPIAPVPGARNL